MALLYIKQRINSSRPASHARMEWGVETMHWLLDVRYREDYFRAQKVHK